MTATGRVHIVGAGIAGLAAAVTLAADGHRISLYEASQHAGGRCRSFFDPELGCRIDNGNHLLLAANTAALAYIERTSALETFERPDQAEIPFIDVATGEQWVLRPNRSPVPWWLFDSSRRVPGTRPGDYLEALALRRAPATATIARVLDPRTRLFKRLWQPLAVAALNTGVEEGSARLFWRVLVETLGRGGAACRALVPHTGLSESLVDPALALLKRQGTEIRFGTRLRRIRLESVRVAELIFDEKSVAVTDDDCVILAAPPSVAARLVPGLVVPDDYAPIVNAHFRYGAPSEAPLFAGLVGGTAEWVFKKPEVVSVTVSAADRLIEEPAEALAPRLWRDVAAAYRIAAEPVPPARIVKERRATFRATPGQLERRPATATRWNNLHLAGDYVDTGLPATIEGAIRSGLAAAARAGRDRNPAAAVNSVTTRPTEIPETTEDRQRALP
ncbi:MAG: FAD-dependent oxidoreductase [Alphaproteobacteria bacterium]|nr:FAD-dependent oxidoreductase [Alphaproteobacteria bacterium]